MALCAVLCAGVVALFLVPSAAADFDFCPPGAGAGQCADPNDTNGLRGLALDTAEGLLYVADRRNNRIDVFQEDGDFVKAFGWGVKDGTSEPQSCGPAIPEANPNPALCRTGIAGAGKGQMKGPISVAVDNDPASPSFHSLYVVDRDNFRVQKFGPAGEFIWAVGKGVDQTSAADLCTAASGHVCGAGANSEAEGGFSSQIGSHFFAAVGSGGVLYVLDNLLIPGGEEFEHRLQRFKADGTPATSQCVFAQGKRAVALAVEPGGGFWVASEAIGEGIRRYDAACAEKAAIAADVEAVADALAFDGEGRLFAAQGDGKPWVVTAHDTAGAIISRFGYGRFSFKPEGLAAGPAGVFLGLGPSGIRLLESPPPPLDLPTLGPIIAPESVEVSAKNTRAKVGFEVNPEGKATSYRFEWVDLAHFEAEGFEGPTVGESPEPVAVEIPEGGEFHLQPVEGTIGCPVASKQLIEEEKCLRPETKYRFRAVATNADNPAGTGEARFEGEFKTKKALEIEAIFTTGVGVDSATLEAEVDPLGLPATGYFEYVTEAAYKSDIEAGGDGFAAAQKVPDVDAEPPEAEIPLGGGEGTVVRGTPALSLAPDTGYRYRFNATNALISEYLQSEEVGSFTTFRVPKVPLCPNDGARIGAGALLPDCRAYEMVSPLDKGGSDIRVLGDTTVLEQSALSGDRLAYGSVRSFGDAASAPWTSQYIAQRVEGVGWETHAIGPERGDSVVGGAAGETDTEFRFFSPDLCRSWLTSFTEVLDPPPGYVPGFSNLFRRDDRLCGAERLEALAPRVGPKGLPVGTKFAIEVQGVSADLEHAIFVAAGGLAPGGKGSFSQLYESHPGPGGAPALRLVCVLPDGSALNGACSAGTGLDGVKHHSSSVTGAISPGGERIYWSDRGFGEGQIYVRVNGAKTAETVAVSPGPAFFWGASNDGAEALFTSGGGLYEFSLAGKSTQQLAGGALGVMGMSEDAKRIYFASSEKIPGSGENVVHEEAVAGEPNLYLREEGEGGSVTTFIATLAEEDLAETDINGPNGAIAREPRKRSARVSPDGVHAAFTSFAPLTGYDNRDVQTGRRAREVFLYDAVTDRLICASCNPSGARPLGAPSREGTRIAGQILGFGTQTHPTRVLSDDGRRLFFESSDVLVPGDSNGAIDVYQWEAPGKGGPGDCEEADSDFAATAAGCVSLISSGQSPIDSRFVEATPDGGDVFFATLASLLPQDYDLIDIYDARVGGGLPVPVPPPPGCEGEACQSPPPPPENPTPASSIFQGVGNLPATAHSKCARSGRKAKSGARRAKRQRGGRAKRCRARARTTEKGRR